MLKCAHTAWKSTSAPLFFCTFGKKIVGILKISRGQLAPSQECRIMPQETVSSAGCKVLAPNAGCLLASMPSYCRFRTIECCYSQSVSVSVPQDKIRGSAICHSYSQVGPLMFQWFERCSLVAPGTQDCTGVDICSARRHFFLLIWCCRSNAFVLR